MINFYSKDALALKYLLNRTSCGLYRPAVLIDDKPHRFFWEYSFAAEEYQILTSNGYRLGIDSFDL